MNSILDEIRKITHEQNIAVNYDVKNPYTINVIGNDGSKKSYCFSVPIYDYKTGTLTKLSFTREGDMFCSYGANAKVSLRDEIYLENGKGFCKIKLAGKPGVISKCTNEVRKMNYGTIEVMPTLNGVLLKIPCEINQKAYIGFVSGQENMPPRANDRYYSLVEYGFKPFATISCLGAFDIKNKLIAPATFDYKILNETEHELYLYHNSPFGKYLLVEVNLQESKLFLDTTIESKLPDTSNAFGTTAFLGDTATYGEQWLYSRPDFSLIKDLCCNEVRKATLYVPRLGSECELAAGKMFYRFCSFGTTWRKKIESLPQTVKAQGQDQYIALDVSTFFINRFNLLMPNEGFLLKGINKQGHCAIATGDSCAFPQILELKY